MSGVDTKLDCFDTYFDQDIYLDDLVDMSEEEREAYFEQLIEQYDLSETQSSDFKEALDAELSDLYAIVYEQQQQLEAIIDSDLSTDDEKAAAEAAMTDLEDLMPYLTGDISSDWGDAEDSWEERSVEITSGEDYTHDPDDPQNGGTYTITVTDAVTDSAYEDDESLADLDGDGFNDDDLDANDDGIADEDYDEDGVITEADLTYSADTDRSQVTIDLEDGDSIEMSSYDAETDTVTFKITKEDGTEYYVKIVGDADIICSVPPTNLDAMPSDVTSRMYEFENSEHSVYYMLEGHDPEEYASYYSIYNSSDYTGNSVPEITPTTEDWENGRSYTITLDEDVADTVTLNFGDDVELEFSEGTNGELIITATNAEGQVITITIENWSTAADENGDVDAITINGGIIDDSDIAALNSIGAHDSGAYDGDAAVGNIIYHDDSDDSIFDENTEPLEAPPPLPT